MGNSLFIVENSGCDKPEIKTGTQSAIFLLNSWTKAKILVRMEKRI
jgi:hypothetical protein